MVKPDFVIIGAQKSGSTALMRHLADHPAIYLPKDETRYFRDPWFWFEDPAVLSTAVAPAQPGASRRGIKCPDLLASPTSPDRIRARLGLVDLIAILRNPVSRAVSAYYWYMQWGWLPIAPANDGIPRLLDGTYQAEYPRAAEILDYGRYGTHVRRFLEVFPYERLHVLLSDDLRSDAARATSSVFRFLDVTPDISFSGRSREANTSVYSQRRLRFLRHRHRWIMREFSGYAGTYKQEPSNPIGWIMDRTIAGIDRVVLARMCDNSQPSVAPDIRAALADYYRDDIALLADTIDCDLESWIPTTPQGCS